MGASEQLSMSIFSRASRLLSALSTTQARSSASLEQTFPIQAGGASDGQSAGCVLHRMTPPAVLLVAARGRGR